MRQNSDTVCRRVCVCARICQEQNNVIEYMSFAPCLTPLPAAPFLHRERELLSEQGDEVRRSKLMDEESFHLNATLPFKWPAPSRSGTLKCPFLFHNNTADQTFAQEPRRVQPDVRESWQKSGQLLRHTYKYSIFSPPCLVSKHLQCWPLSKYSNLNIYMSLKGFSPTERNKKSTHGFVLVWCKEGRRKGEEGEKHHIRGVYRSLLAPHMWLQSDV